jgi:hypothetical protein
LRFRSMARAAVPVLTLSLVLVACGDDDDEATDTTEATDEAGGENEELCALAQEMFEQESFPTPEQIEQYTELAPEELQDAVAIAGPPIIEGGGDLSATLVAVADDGSRTRPSTSRTGSGRTATSSTSPVTPRRPTSSMTRRPAST